MCMRITWESYTNEDSDLVSLGWARVFALLLVHRPYFESRGSHQEFKHMPISTADFKWYFVKFTHFLLPVSLPNEQWRRARTAGQVLRNVKVPEAQHSSQRIYN